MIPEVIHFIWVSLGETLNELQMLAIASAVYNTKCKVVLHTDDPSISISGVETRSRVFPTTINGTVFNKDDDVKHLNARRISHLKDVVRLQILYDEGGIYSDLDVVWLRHPWRFLHSKKGVVMGYQHKAYKTLCNAVMFACAHHPLIKEYLDWTISIYPPKKYWLPANPYKLWLNKPDVEYVDKYHFFPRNYGSTDTLELNDYDRSTCIHLYQSGPSIACGSLIDLLRDRVKIERLKNTVVVTSE